MSAKEIRASHQADGFLDSDIRLALDAGRNGKDIKSIILVMGNRLFRDGIELVLRHNDMSVVGSCGSLAEAQECLATQPPPDLIIFGMSKKEFYENSEEIKRLRALSPNVKWVILCSQKDLDLFGRLGKGDVDGVILEEAPREALHLLANLVLLGYFCLPTMDRAARNDAPGDAVYNLTGEDGSDRIIQPLTAPAPKRISSHFSRSEKMPGEMTPLQTAGISGRERDIMHCLMSGQSNKIIARELNISEATVKVHVKALLRKMRVTNRTQAAIWALNTMRSADLTL